MTRSYISHAAAATFVLARGGDAFSATSTARRALNRESRSKSYSVNHWQGSDDNNAWTSSADDANAQGWETVLEKQKDGSYWSDFESSETTDEFIQYGNLDDETEIMLNTLAALQAEDSVFNFREAQRADTARRMEEWGFDASTIASALDVSAEEGGEEAEAMHSYRQDSYVESVDLTTVESHTKVPRDAVTQEPVRSQMVYVNEHACIGCTNCAMIAQSTFFMEEENGRARVFEQWGDDDATIEIAMDTCPVNCIHYIPYEELMQLEVKRRDQYINVVGGLVGRAERGAGNSVTALTPRSFGAKRFTDAPKVSSSGNDRNSPEFVAEETLRLVMARRKELVKERRQDNKIVDL